MDTRKIAAEYRLAHWAKVMQERISSGQSIQDFCQEKRVSQNTFFYWQRKLRQAACEQISTQSFAEVKLLKPATQPPAAEKSQAGQICVAVAGMHITADSSYPAEKLTALLRALRQL